MLDNTDIEFSRPFPVEKLRSHAMTESIEANEEELEALARRLDVVALKGLRATMQMQRIHSGEMVEVRGRLDADVVQNCVVTLEPFESTVTEEFTAYFARPGSMPKEEEVAIDDDASPEPIGADGMIDLGELTAQHLSLALDPHPRKPGVTFETPEAAADGPANPFAVLADFRAKKDGKKGDKG